MNSVTHTEPRSSVSSLPEHRRNRPPRSWFVTQHRCHFVMQRLCLATQTTLELARSERTATQKSPRRSVGNAALAGERHRWTGSARRERTRHSVNCNDSLGHRRAEPQRKIPLRQPGRSRSKICCHWLKTRLVPSKFSKIVLGGTAASHTCSGVGGGHF